MSSLTPQQHEALSAELKALQDENDKLRHLARRLLTWNVTFPKSANNMTRNEIIASELALDDIMSELALAAPEPVVEAQLSQMG